MTALVHQSEEEDRAAIHFIINIKREWSGSPARIPMRSHVITSAAPNYLPHLLGNPSAQSTPQALRNLFIPLFRRKQVGFESAAENSLHCGVSKTCSKVRPESFPEIKSLRRRFNSDFISSSVRLSPSRL